MENILFYLSIILPAVVGVLGAVASEPGERRAKEVKALPHPTDAMMVVETRKEYEPYQWMN